MDSKTPRPGAPASSRRPLRARISSGRTFENPSIGLLRDLVYGLGPGNPYLVIDRLDAPDGDFYAQTLHRPDGSWIVEYRDGGRNRHYQALAPGPSAVHQVLAAWALGLPGWRGRLTWQPVFQ
jgi:hypothetical protein